MILIFYIGFLVFVDYGGPNAFSHRGFPFGLYAIALFFYACFALKIKKINSLVFYFILGLFLRFFSLWQIPYSQDYLRFISDGLLLVEGKNPYWEKPTLDVEYPEMKSMYFITLWPYFLFLALFSKIFPYFIAAKILPAFFEITLSVFLAKKQKPVAWFYLTNPLSIFETWHEAHFEIIPVGLLILAFYFLKQKKQKIFLFLSCLSGSLKLYGFFLFPIFFVSRKKFLQIFVFNFAWLIFYLFLCLSLVPTLFFHATLPGQNSGLVNYFHYWHHGQIFMSLFFFLQIKQKIAVLCLYGLFLFGYLWALFYWLFIKKDVQKFLFYFFVSFILFFPVQHPWYYMLLFVYIAFFQKHRDFFILQTILVGLNYLTYTPFFDKSFLPPFLRLFFCFGGYFLLQKFFYNRIPGHS